MGHRTWLFVISVCLFVLFLKEKSAVVSDNNCEFQWRCVVVSWLLDIYGLGIFQGWFVELPAMGLSCHTATGSPRCLWEGPGQGLLYISSIQTKRGRPGLRMQPPVHAGQALGGRGRPVVRSLLSSAFPYSQNNSETVLSANRLLSAPALNLGSKGLLNQVVGTRGWGRADVIQGSGLSADDLRGFHGLEMDKSKRQAFLFCSAFSSCIVLPSSVWLYWQSLQLLQLPGKWWLYAEDRPLLFSFDLLLGLPLSRCSLCA